MCSLLWILLLTMNLGPVWSLALQSRQDSRPRAAYFLDNDPAGDSIVSLNISVTDGTLAKPVRTPTGGKGLTGLIAISQDSVIVSQEYIFTVNPGSNTLSMFIIDPKDPWHPKLVGTPADTLGDTPVSVAYSTHLKTACVLNGGLIAGVTCYSVDHAKGLTALGPLRLIPQTEDQDPTPPPPGPLVLASDIVFNPSSTALFVAVRSNGKLPGLMYVWPVTNKQVSTTPVVSTFPDLVFLFSINFLGSDSRILSLNPHLGSPGATLLEVSPSFQVTEQKSILIEAQLAVCWAVYAQRFDSAFVADAGQPIITILNPETGDIRGTIHYATDQLGGFDITVDRTWLYILLDSQTNPKIDVFSLQGLNERKLPQLVQSFDISAEVGVIPDLMGLRIYPSS